MKRKGLAPSSTAFLSRCGEDVVCNLCDSSLSPYQDTAHEVGMHGRSTSPRKAKLCIANALEHSGTDL